MKTEEKKTTEIDLYNLLKLEGRKDIHKCFTEIADLLINNYCLNVNGEKFRMIEIEFYLNTPEHPDVFSHSDPLQENAGVWYFHRHQGCRKETKSQGGKTSTLSRLEGYIENSFKGLDITLQGGGILIRSLESLIPSRSSASEDKKGNITEGPSKVVDLILKGMKCEKVSDLVKILEESKLSVFGPLSKLSIQPHKFESKKIYGTPRVGLSLKKDYDERLSFIMKMYRFSCSYGDIKKNRHLVVISLKYFHKIHELEEIMEISGAKKYLVERYLKGCLESCKVKGKKTFKTSTVPQSIELFCHIYKDLITQKE